MKYTKYTINTIIEAEDIIAAELAALGIDGVEISDSNLPADDGVPVFIDDLPDNPLKNGEAHLSFYLDADKDNTEIIEAVREMLKGLRGGMDIGEGSLDSEDTADSDWLNNWKEYFHQFTIDFEDGKTALFLPSWEKLETDTSEYDYVINIDPGTAFGTGAHETTALCIKALHKYLKPGGFLVDIGTGSGILSIMGLKFGARGAIGTDIDPNAQPAVEKNLKDNGIAPQDFEFVNSDILTDAPLRARLKGSADIMTANILPDVLIPLFPIAGQILKAGGIIIVSGVIASKADYVRNELQKNNFSLLEEASKGEWMEFTAKLDS